MEIKNIVSSLTELSTTSGLALIIVFLLTLLLTRLLTDGYYRSPGPWGIPILGYYPFLSKTKYHLQLTELSKKYGDAYLFSLCGRRFLHLSSLKALKEAFVTKSDSFSSRPIDFSLFNAVLGEGMGFLNGEKWRTLKKFFVQSMRELGIGAKEQLQDPLYIALNDTIHKLRESKSQPVNMTSLLSTNCTEVIRSLMLGENVSRDISQKLNNAYLTALAPMISHYILLYGNLAKYLILRRLPGYDTMLSAKEEMYTLLQEIVDNHKANLDLENPRDLVDMYLRERKIREEKNDPQAKYFTDTALVATLLQMYGDGGLSISFVITSYLKFLASKPQVQEEIHDEIMKVIGNERLPNYEDRARLPLMNSVMKELYRQFTLFSTFASLEATRDTTVSGVNVPKGTIAVINFYAIHKDPNVYENPNSFDCKRFLSSGENRHQKELPILFGVGKRACPGESLVSTEVFLFLTSILQNFTIHLTNEDKAVTTDLEQELEETMECMLIANPR